MNCGAWYRLYLFTIRIILLLWRCVKGISSDAPLRHWNQRCSLLVRLMWLGSYSLHVRTRIVWSHREQKLWCFSIEGVWYRTYFLPWNTSGALTLLDAQKYVVIVEQLISLFVFRVFYENPIVNYTRYCLFKEVASNKQTFHKSYFSTFTSQYVTLTLFGQ